MLLSPSSGCARVQTALGALACCWHLAWGPATKGRRPAHPRWSLTQLSVRSIPAQEGVAVLQTELCRWQARATLQTPLISCSIAPHRAIIALQGTATTGGCCRPSQSNTGRQAPRMMRNWRARERPSSSHARPLDLSWGTTSVRMGTLGRYLATRLAVRPVPA